MHKILLLSFIFLAAVLQGCRTADPLISYESKLNICNEETTRTVLSENIYVAVYGEVMHPGIYVVPKGTRVFEAINMAGGVTAQGDPVSLNLVECLEKDIKIIVPAIKEESTPTDSDKSSVININQAGADSLVTLTGIGPTKAADIVRFRERNGPFQSVDELLNVPGIGNSTLERIRDYVTVE